MSAQTFSCLPAAKSLPLHLHLPCLSWHRYKEEQAVVQDELFQVVMREREAITKYWSAFLLREGSVDQEKQKSALMVSADLPELAFHAFTMQGSRGRAWLVWSPGHRLPVGCPPSHLCRKSIFLGNRNLVLVNLVVTLICFATSGLCFLSLWNLRSIV